MNDTDNFFIWELVIILSSFEKYFYSFSFPFLIGVLGVFTIFEYFLYPNHQGYIMCRIKIFPYPVSCLLVLLHVSYVMQKLFKQMYTYSLFYILGGQQPW